MANPKNKYVSRWRLIKAVSVARRWHGTAGWGVRIAVGLSFEMGVLMDRNITLFMEGRYAIRLGAIREVLQLGTADYAATTPGKQSARPFLCLFSACSRRLWGKNHLLAMALSRMGRFTNQRTRGPWWSAGKSACRPGRWCSWPSRSVKPISDRTDFLE